MKTHFSKESGYIVAELEPRAIEGNKCIGFYNLIFNFQMTINPERENPFMLKSFTGKVFYGNTSNALNYLGLARMDPDIFIQSLNNNYDETISLNLRLDAGQIEAIEREREGRGVDFRIQISAEYLEKQFPEIITKDVYVPVNQSEWLDFLRNSGYINLLLFEVPIPDESDNPNLAEAVKRLQEARKHFANGEYNQTVALCRMVIESLNNGLGEAEAVREATSKYKGNQNTRGMDNREREFLFRSAIIHYAHLAHHPLEDGNSVQFKRREASMALGLTCCIISTALI